MRKLYLAISLLLLSQFSPAQILINEVCSAGDSAFVDEDGTVQDWVEFYNAGSSPVNLAGYKIKCVQNNDVKFWTFPQMIIDPQQHLTVFFSGKNRTDFFDHWEVPVFPTANFRYFPATVEPTSNWKDVSFNDGSWTLAPGPIGYGDGDDATVISPVISLYERYSFNIADTSKIAMAAFLVDFDDAFVAYLNGKEIARWNIGAQGYPPAYSDMAFDEHEAVQYQTGGWSGIMMVPGSSLDTIINQGINTLAIQTHNFIGGMDDLTMIPAMLIGVIDTVVTYFPFPVDMHLHTSFELNSAGSILTLYNSLGQIEDEQIIGQILLNHSRGRQPDGSANWCLFDRPTPDTTNYSTSCFAGYASSPVISLASGFYTGSQFTSITATDAGIINWTYTGSDPKPIDPVYTGTITIGNTQVIRAKLFPSNPSLLPGPIAAATYFVNENVTLPVVSLSTDPANLFNPITGIYVMGNNVPDQTITGIPFYNANFWQGWKRPADVSFFDKNKDLQFQQPVSISIQGNWSKVFPQRGFTIDINENYGGQTINYQLFPDKPATKYSSFNVRNAGSDWNTAHMRDRLIQKSVQQSTSLDIMDGYSCILFLNGQYWGVYEVREKQDKKYIANNSTTDDDNVDFLQFDGNVINGDNLSFFKMVKYISTVDMTLQTSYDSACALLDIPNFCDYFITETFVGNQDWLGLYTNNIKFWKPHDQPGKWRYILWDTDISFQSDTINKLAQVINPPTANPHSEMLAAMLVNDTFRNYFINRYADLINTTFHNQTMLRNTEAFYNEMLPEMPRDFAMWGTGTSPFSPTCVQGFINVAGWRNNINNLEYFEFVRPYYVRNQIQSQFAMISQVDVSLKTEPAGAGTIHLNTITPDSIPWTGVYFNGNPITMTAIAKPGYKFLYWKSNNVISENYPFNSLTTNVDVSDTFAAVFAPLESVFMAYPNPFYDDLTLYYELPEASVVTLRVYDVTGRLVEEILPASNYQAPGAYQIKLPTGTLNLANGMYLFQLSTSSFTKTIKLVGGRPKP